MKKFKGLIQSLILLLLLVLSSCVQKDLNRDEIVFTADFETNQNIEQVDGWVVRDFNNTTVLGNFNNDGATFHIQDIGSHDYIYVSLDLYVHDTWDGNANGLDPDQGDLWKVSIRPGLEFPTNEKMVYTTSFSNTVCNFNYCFKQSYPDEFPSIQNPKRFFSSGLPGIYSLEYQNDGTSLYRISFGFPHEGNALIIRFFDELFQPNAPDLPIYDESWSMDNLKIRAISYE
jgi:hypothetical protein